MHGLILAGGLGTRMRSVTGDELPKALIPIGPHPFIHWQMLWLRILGLQNVILALGHGGELIEKYFSEQKDQAFPKIKFLYDGPTLLGTGGAIKQALSLLPERFFVTYGDSFLFYDPLSMLDAHIGSAQPVTFAVYKNEGLGDTSNVAIRGGSVFYDKFHLSADMNYIDYGVILLEKFYYQQNTPDGPFDFATFLNEACKAGKVSPHISNNGFFEVGSVAGLQRFSDFLKENAYNLKAISKKMVFNQ